MSRAPREKRRRPRIRTRQAAWIRDGAGAELVPCVLWDQSECGARIAAAYCNKLPRVFTLLRSGEPERVCRIVWRKDGLAGVQFVESPADGDALAAAQGAPGDYPEPAAPSADAAALATLGWHPEAAEHAAKGTAYLTSFVAGGFVIALVALTILFYFAGHESASGVAWAEGICREANGMCRHPEFSGGASLLMAVVYLAVKGMELRD